MAKSPDEFEATLCLVRRSLHGIEGLQRNLEITRWRIEFSDRVLSTAQGILDTVIDVAERDSGEPV